MFPKAQFIHVVRDGGDVVASYLETGIYPGAEEAAWRWRTAVDLCRRFEEASPRSYLDLVTEPRQTVAGICAFLGTPFDERMLEPRGEAARLGDVPRRGPHREVLESVSADKIGKGRNALSEEQKRLVKSIIAKQMAELGYADLRSS